MAPTTALKYLLPTEKICVQLGLRRDPDAWKYWRQEKGMTEDKTDVITNSMDVSLSFPEVGDGQGGLVCCSPWGLKELDTTELTELGLPRWH